jgi:hypothetical protein
MITIRCEQLSGRVIAERVRTRQRYINIVIRSHHADGSRCERLDRSTGEDRLAQLFDRRRRIDPHRLFAIVHDADDHTVGQFDSLHIGKVVEALIKASCSGGGAPSATNPSSASI